MSAATPSYQSISITVSAPKTSWSGTSVTLNPGSSVTITIPNTLQLSGNAALEGKGILLQASRDVVVFASNQFSTYCGGYQVIPLSSLGTDYYVITEWPAFPYTYSYAQIAVVATDDNTQVVITFNVGKGINVIYNGNTYDENTPLSVTLQKYQTLQLQETLDQADFTGSRITSNKPIAVFSGDRVVGFTNNIVFDHMVEQMIPISAYDRNFAIIATPNQDPSGVSTLLKIISQGGDPTVTIAGGTSNMQIVYPSQTYHDHPEVSINNQQFFCVQSTLPIMVAQVVKDRSNWQYGTPSLVVIPGTSQYLSSYVVNIPQIVTTAYLLISIADNTYNYIKIDGNSITGVTWVPFVGCATAMYGAYVPVTSGQHFISHQYAHYFGVYVYGLDSTHQCSIAMAGGGMCLSSSRVSFIHFI